MTETKRATTVLARHRWIARFRLRVVVGPDQETIAESVGTEVSVGTAEGNDLRLTDTSVSRHHCSFRLTAEGILLQDLDSTNTTQINGVRINAGYVIPGARVTVGRTSLAVEAMDREYCEALSKDAEFGDLVGVSDGMRHVFAMAAKFAETDGGVLIEGETGCGKGLLAEAIHDASARRAGPFTVVDCASLPSSLIESELFGHEPGAFTGAVGQRIGLFESSHGGTVFLDEIGELSLALQPKLLRVVESRTISRVGSTERIPVDFRLVAATNRDLRRCVNSGTFRADLLYRLNTLRIRIPPLRDRRDDIPVLIARFYDEMTGGTRQPPPELIAVAAQADWPGNVRELRNAVERNVISAHDPEMLLDAPFDPSASQPVPPVETLAFKTAKQSAMSQWEESYLRSLVTLTEGNLTRAAQVAKVDRGHLRQLLRRYKLR